MGPAFSSTGETGEAVGSGGEGEHWQACAHYSLALGLSISLGSCVEATQLGPVVRRNCKHRRHGQRETAATQHRPVTPESALGVRSAPRDDPPPYPLAPFNTATLPYGTDATIILGEHFLSCPCHSTSRQCLSEKREADNSQSYSVQERSSTGGGVGQVQGPGNPGWADAHALRASFPGHCLISLPFHSRWRDSKVLMCL
jgi:hypothetical protein